MTTTGTDTCRDNATRPIGLRPYPVDSPEAAARLVALTMLCDGTVTRRELDLVQPDASRNGLGVDGAVLGRVVQELGRDLLPPGGGLEPGGCVIDPMSLDRLLDEVAAPELREQVLLLSLAVAEVDAEVSDGERLVLTHMVERWGLQARMFEPVPSRGEV